MKLLGGAAIATLSIATMPLLAQTPPPPGVSQGTAPPPMVAPMRSDAPAPVVRENVEVRMMSDHVMTRDDVVRHVREMFRRFDANGDGYVTREELGAFHAKFANMGPMIRERIEDHGMKMGSPAAMFDRLDANHDGSISRQEFMAAHARMTERREEHVVVMNKGDGPGEPAMDGMEHQKMEFRFKTREPMPGMDGDHMKMRMEGMDGEHMKMRMHGEGMGMGFGSPLFEMADTNHDGRVSLQEAEGLALQHFDRADVNHDGKIEPDEHQQMHVMMMRERRPG